MAVAEEQLMQLLRGPLYLEGLGRLRAAQPRNMCPAPAAAAIVCSPLQPPGRAMLSSFEFAQGGGLQNGSSAMNSD